MMINVLSLFNGISCGRVALERAEINVSRYVSYEIDEYANKIAKKNYPNDEYMGDVTAAEFTQYKGFDLLMGGSPCQGFSFAGKQLNFNDERSKLFFQFIIALNSIQPKYFLLENVRMKKEYQDVISRLIGVEPIKINSALVSAQNRERLYWTNIPGVKQPKDKGVLLKDIIENGIVDKEKSYCIDANYFKGGNLKSYFEKHRRQLVFTDSNFKDYRKLTPMEAERLQTLPDNYTAGVSGTQRYKAIGNGWTVDVIAHILKNMELTV